MADVEGAHQMFAVAMALVEQAQDLLERSVQTDEAMQFVSSHIPGSTVGKHLRHIYDHFNLLLLALDDPNDLLNYDARGRNVPMETSRSESLSKLKGLDDRLKGRSRQAEKIMTRRFRLSALTPFPQEFDTNFARELWFCSLHAIHHFSLIRVIVSGELNLDVPATFGVAPSTMAFRQWEAGQHDMSSPSVLTQPDTSIAGGPAIASVGSMVSRQTPAGAPARL